MKDHLPGVVGRKLRGVERRQRIQQSSRDSLGVILHRLAYVDQEDFAGIEQLFDLFRVELGDLIGCRLTHLPAFCGVCGAGGHSIQYVQVPEAASERPAPP